MNLLIPELPYGSIAIAGIYSPLGEFSIMLNCVNHAEAYQAKSVDEAK